MRIVHVSNFFGPRSGGRDSTLNALAAGYQHAGHEFFSIVPGTTNTWSHAGIGTRITIAVPTQDGGRFSETAAAILHTVDRLAPDRLEVADRLTFRSLGAWASRTSTPAVYLMNGSPAAWLLSSAAARAGATRGRRGGSSTDQLAQFGRVISTTHTGEVTLRAALPSVADRVPLGVDLETFSPLRWSA
ncbi:MAG TPA: hypothetical protein VGP24_09145, partial [Glaciihabitans sp.]|nr:hypothetical protein [Glaciihabitans sp.]